MSEEADALPGVGEAQDEGGDHTWMSPATAKAFIALGLFCGTMLFAVIPVLLSRRSHGRRAVVRHVLTGLSCLGGGVFLATCFLHLMPEAVEKMEKALEDRKIELDFPLPNAIIVVGFLLVLLLEQAIHTFTGSSGHSHSPPAVANQATPVPHYGSIRRDALEEPESQDNGEAGDQPTSDSDEDDHMTTISTHGDPGSHSSFRAVVMVFALSLHSVFEGMAIGLQETTRDVVQLFGAIAVHKCVIAVTLATSLVSASTRLSNWVVFSCLAVFAAMAPIGIGIAIALDGAPPMVSGVLQCIAAGTFVYITFFEILPHELNSRHTEGSRALKIFMLLAGIGLIVVIMLVVPDKD